MSAEAIRVDDDIAMSSEQVHLAQILGNTGSEIEVAGMFASADDLLHCLESLSEKLHHLDRKED